MYVLSYESGNGGGRGGLPETLCVIKTCSSPLAFCLRSSVVQPEIPESSAALILQCLSKVSGFACAVLRCAYS